MKIINHSIEYFDKEANYYTEKRNNGLLSRFIKKEKVSVMGLLNIEKDEEILDAGCGDGDYSISIKNTGGIPYGIDISPQMIEKYLT